MEKVLLSNEEVEALESAIEISGVDKANVVAWHAKNCLWEGKLSALNDLDLDTVIRALYVGYEIEPTPEEKLLKMYESYPDGGQSRSIIQQVIGVLNLQIQGINC